MRGARALLLILLPAAVAASPDGTTWRDFRLGMGEQEFARKAVTLGHVREVNRIRKEFGEPNAGIQVLNLESREERYVDPAVPNSSVTVTDGHIFRFIAGRFLAGKLNRLEVCVPTEWMKMDEILSKSRERYGPTDVPFAFESVREMVPEVWVGSPGNQRRATTSTTYTGRLWRFDHTFLVVYGAGSPNFPETCLTLQDPTKPSALADRARKAAEESAQRIREKQKKQVEGIRF